MEGEGLAKMMYNSDSNTITHYYANKKRQKGAKMACKKKSGTKPKK